MKLSVATKKDARMWFVPSKLHALDTQGHTSDQKKLSVVPADWSEDFQLALNCVSVHLWWVPVFPVLNSNPRQNAVEVFFFSHLYI